MWWLGGCGHEWEATIANRDRAGSGCPYCARHVSKAEKRIKEFLIELDLTVEGSNRTILTGQEINLWLPEKKIGIEFNGIYWHSERYRKQNFHRDKWLASKVAGIQLVQIWEDDWNLRPEIIMRTLAHKLGVSETGSPTINTKTIIITEQQAEEFLNENHLQGFASGSHYLGLVVAGDIEN